MPARKVINTESVVGYNNQLKQAEGGMNSKFGINYEVSKDTKRPKFPDNETNRQEG